MTWHGPVHFDGTWDHFPETTGRGGKLCAGCAYGSRTVEFIGIGTVRRAKDYTCELEPNQPRRVANVVSCEAFHPRPGRVRQARLEEWYA